MLSQFPQGWRDDNKRLNEWSPSTRVELEVSPWDSSRTLCVKQHKKSLHEMFGLQPDFARKAFQAKIFFRGYDTKKKISLPETKYDWERQHLREAHFPCCYCYFDYVDTLKNHISKSQSVSEPIHLFTSPSKNYHNHYHYKLASSATSSEGHCHDGLAWLDSHVKFSNVINRCRKTAMKSMTWRGVASAHCLNVNNFSYPCPNFLPVECSNHSVEEYTWRVSYCLHIIRFVCCFIWRNVRLMHSLSQLLHKWIGKKLCM